MTETQAKIIACGLLHDGLNVEKLSAKAREELREAVNVLLELTRVTDHD